MANLSKQKEGETATHYRTPEFCFHTATPERIKKIEVAMSMGWTLERAALWQGCNVADVKIRMGIL